MIQVCSEFQFLVLVVRQMLGVNSNIEECCLPFFVVPEEAASDSAASKEKDKEKEDLPFDDPVCITLEYFRYVILS